jgi:uncharacterized protein YjdB
MKKREGRKKTALHCLLLFLMLSSAQHVSAQAGGCANLPPLKTFMEYADVRGELKNDIPDLQRDIEELQATKIPQARKAEQDLEETGQKLQALEAKPNKTAPDQEQINSLTALKASLQNILGGNTLESYQEELIQKQNALAEKKVQLRCVEEKISEMLSPEQSFKYWMSLFFAILIALVITGFFVLSAMDKSLRNAIFSGQSGIQFLTLFSLVIAIILFGITGILQDKELAALLGGLSGYILGRYNMSGRKDAESEDNADESKAGPAQSVMNKLATISLAPEAVTLSSAAPTQALTITPLDAKGNAIKDEATGFSPAWATSDPAVATVDQSGLVKFVASGNCNITAYFQSVASNPCAVTCS